MNDRVEQILENNIIKTNDNKFGYMIDLETVKLINKLGYNLHFLKEGIKYIKN